MRKRCFPLPVPDTLRRSLPSTLAGGAGCAYLLLLAACNEASLAPRRSEARPRFDVSQEPGAVPMFVSSQFNQLYIFAVTPADASLQSVYSGPGLNQPIGLALNSPGDLFVINSENQSTTSGSIARYAVNGYTIGFQDTFGSGQLSDPFWADFRGNELLIAQAQGNDVGRFIIAPDGSASFNGTFGSFQNPNARGIAVSPNGDVFVSECCGTDRVSRFVASGSDFVLASTFHTNDFNSIHGMAVSPSGELFVASPGSNTVVRVQISGDGTMTENGVISDPALNGPIGVGFSPWGELFVANVAAGSIVRFRFDDAGTAVQNGVITTPGSGLHDVKFPRGPLYHVCLLYDPTKVVKSGATVPIKLQLCDGTGGNLSSSTIVLHGTNVIQTSTAVSGPVYDSGNANPENDFRFDPTLGSTGGYIFNLSTKGLSTGTYNLKFTVTGDSFVYAVPFQVK